MKIQDLFEAREIIDLRHKDIIDKSSSGERIKHSIKSKGEVAYKGTILPTHITVYKSN